MLKKYKQCLEINHPFTTLLYLFRRHKQSVRGLLFFKPFFHILKFIKWQLSENKRLRYKLYILSYYHCYFFFRKIINNDNPDQHFYCLCTDLELWSTQRPLKFQFTGNFLSVSQSFMFYFFQNSLSFILYQIIDFSDVQYFELLVFQILSFCQQCRT